MREGIDKQAPTCALVQIRLHRQQPGHLAPEVNCSPTFEHSTPVTARMVRELSADIISHR
jgi:hypothetical protein